MRKEMLLVYIFVKFGYNYPNPEEFINYICEKTGKNYLKDHIRGKFNRIYHDYGRHAVMNRFFVELDLDLQEALVDYAINVYSPECMRTKYEEYKSL